MEKNPPPKTTAKALDSKVVLIISAVAAPYFVILYFSSCNYFDKAPELSAFYSLNAATFVPVKDNPVSFFIHSCLYFFLDILSFMAYSQLMIEKKDSPASFFI